MEVEIILLLSIPFVAVLGWITVRHMNVFFLNNWRDNEKEDPIYSHSVPIRVMDENFVRQSNKNPDTETIARQTYQEISNKPGKTWKDLAYVILTLFACTVVGFCFLRLGLNDTNIVTVYILGVLLIAVFTKEYLYSVTSAFLSVFLFGFFMTEPRLSLRTYAVGYPVTFAVMLLAAIITGTLAAQLKAHAANSAWQAFRMQILFDTNRLLQREKNRKDILCMTCKQLRKLLDCCIIGYVVEDDSLVGEYVFGDREESKTQEHLKDTEHAAVRWVCRSKKCAGASTEHFSNAEYLYMPICTDNAMYGVAGIRKNTRKMDSFECGILSSVLNECALAMENESNIRKREEASVVAKNEQLRADLLRLISHDLRTPLCAISGNADTLFHNGEGLDKATRKQIYTDIYDDAEWLVGVVENLLSVTRLNDNRLELNFTDQLVDEVIDEAVRHVSRQSMKHKIQVDCEELMLARMDTRLIIQVMINLLENAVKYTPDGSEIQVCAYEKEHKVWIHVADYGEGIPDEMKQHVFEMFYTGKKSAADSRRSLGLGLALCKSIVEAHGGQMMLTDNKPHGCIFTFTLPVSEVILNEQNINIDSGR